LPTPTSTRRCRPSPSIVQNAGQTCSAGSRLLTQQDIYDQVMERVGAGFATIGGGTPEMDRTGLYRAGKLPIDRLMGERMPLSDINRGFDRFAAGESLRDLIVF
jgi:Zn-dependent alcohol dehydrogenase